MQIETKFNVRDEVFVMFNNTIYQSKIHTIDIRIYSEGVIIKYAILTSQEGYSYGNITEDKVFSTKQELLNSL